MLNLSLSDIIGAVFNVSVFRELFSVIMPYFGAYLLSLVFYSGKDEDTLLNGRSFILNILLFPAIFYNIFSFGGTTSSFSDTLTSFQTFLNNPTSIFSVLAFIVGFYLIIYIVGIPMTNALKPSSIAFIDLLSWLLFIILLICDFFIIFLNTSLANSIFNNQNSSSSSSSSSSDTSYNRFSQDTSSNDEVFNIANNIYTYETARDACSAYGARLANYHEIENAYNNGGEWCNYGWSEGRMALFPTQTKTWARLEKSEETRNRCGRPGVNGGYMENPELLFGVNCFGKKPQATSQEIQKMQAEQKLAATQANTAATTKQNLKVDFLKNNKDTLLVVNAFNPYNWSEW